MRKLEVELPYPFEITVGEDGVLRFPIIFLYDQPLQSDYIESMREDESLRERLGEVLPPPWDSAGQFQLHTIRVFYKTEKAYSEASLDTSLGEILRKKDYRMPQVPVFHLVSTQTDYIRDFL